MMLELSLRFRHTFRERAAEWVVAVMILGWGMFVVQPDVVMARPFFQPLLRIMSEELWGLCAVAVGTMRIVALFINGSQPRGTPVLRAAGALFGMVLWLTMAVGALSLDYRSPGFVNYLGLFILDTLALCFAVRDAAVANYRHREAMEDAGGRSPGVGAEPHPRLRAVGGRVHGD